MYQCANIYIHQVANCANAIKIACDFISVDNLNRTRRLVGELRHQRLSHSWDEDGVAWGEDAIELEKSLYYAYTSLSRHYKTTTIIQPSYPASISSSVFQDQSPMSIDMYGSLPSPFCQSPNHYHHIAFSSTPPASDSGATTATPFAHPASTPTSVFTDQPPMFIGMDNSLPSSFGQSQTNDNVASSSAPPADGLSRQGMHSPHANMVTSKLSEAQKRVRREKNRMRKIALRHASKTSERDTHPEHKFPCPARHCARRFNRTGVLDHV
jgi:hypothetical protein